MTEHQLQNSILRAFATLPGLRLWRANTGVARYGNRTVRFGVPGQADLTGILPVTLVCPACGIEAGRLGVRLEIEVKSETGKQSDEQRAYENIVTRFGGIYILARSVDDVWARVGEHCK